MAKRIREIEYNVCDECEVKTTYTYKCCLCNKELCHEHAHVSSVGSYYFCTSCWSDKYDVEYKTFTNAWKELKEKQDVESDAFISKFETKMNELIRRSNEHK